MSSSHDRVRDFRADLKNSTYFRIAFAIGVFLSFFFVLGFFVLSVRAATFDVATGWRQFLTAEMGRTFPDVLVAAPSAIATAICLHQGDAVSTSPCDAGPATSPGCIKILGSSISAHPPPVRFAQTVETIAASEYAFDCMILQANATDITVHIGADEKFAEDVHAGSPLGALVPGGATALIAVEPVSVQPDASDAFTLWKTSVQYPVPTVTAVDATRLIVVMNSFIVQNYQQVDEYTGFMATADMGGLAVFLYMIYAYLMFLVGFVVPNDSIVLGGRNNAAAKAEREPILPKSTGTTATGDDNEL